MKGSESCFPICAPAHEDQDTTLIAFKLSSIFLPFLRYKMSSKTVSFSQILAAFKAASAVELCELKALLDAAAAPVVASAPARAPKKAKTVKSVDLLAPVDADAAPAHAAAAAAFASDALAGNKYRLQAINYELCMGRKIDEANPVPGTRPDDEGSNGKFFPETQCSKKPIAGGKLCKICAEKDAAAKADTTKVPKSWYGRLDEPLFWKALVVGCDYFFTKYPAGLPCAPRPASGAVSPAASAASDKAADAVAKKAAKAAKEAAKAAAAAPAEVSESPAAPAEDDKAAKKAAKAAKKAAKAAAAAEAEAAEKAAAQAAALAAIAEAEAATAAAAAKSAKKGKKTAAAAAEPVAAAPAACAASAAKPAAEKPAAKKVVKKATVAADAPAKDVEWISFFYEGEPRVRNVHTGNCYQVDTSKGGSDLESMVCRDKYEGRWKDGKLDPYTEEDEE